MTKNSKALLREAASSRPSKWPSDMHPQNREPRNARTRGRGSKNGQLRSEVNKTSTPSAPHQKIYRITAVPSGSRWIAFFGGERLCTSTAPFVHAARVLIDGGADTEAEIQMWHEGSAMWALRGRVGVVAATVLDGETKAAVCARKRGQVHFNGGPLSRVAGAPA